MIHKKLKIGKNKQATLEVYALDSEISYGVNRKWPAIIICPGGGYLISATKEGEGVATQFLNHGFSCFVLRYSTFLNNRESLINDEPDINQNGYYPNQILELMETMHLLKENAEEWNIDVDNIFTLGFSAGGHIVGTLATRWDDSYFKEKLGFIPDAKELQPKGSILAYPMLTGDIVGESKNSKLMELCLYGHHHPTDEEKDKLTLINYVSPTTSPMFIWHTRDDEVCDAKLTTEFISELQKNDIQCEYHLFSHGKHGLASSNKYYAKNKNDINKNVTLWLPLAINWLEQIIDSEV